VTLTGLFPGPDGISPFGRGRDLCWLLPICPFWRPRLRPLPRSNWIYLISDVMFVAADESATFVAATATAHFTPRPCLLRPRPRPQPSHCFEARCGHQCRPTDTFVAAIAPVSVLPEFYFACARTWAARAADHILCPGHRPQASWFVASPWIDCPLPLFIEGRRTAYPISFASRRCGSAGRLRRRCTVWTQVCHTPSSVNAGVQVERTTRADAFGLLPRVCISACIRIM